MPQAAIVALIFSLRKLRSRKSRGDESASRSVSRSQPSPLARHALKSTLDQRERGHDRAEHAENMRRIAGEGGRHFAPALGVFDREFAGARDRRIEIGADAEPGSVGKGGGECIARRREGEAVARQRRAIGGDEGRAGEQAEVHREQIVPKARQRRLARLHRAARDGVALENADLPALRGEMDRASPDPLCPAPMTIAS